MRRTWMLWATTFVMMLIIATVAFQFFTRSRTAAERINSALTECLTNTSPLRLNRDCLTRVVPVLMHTSMARDILSAIDSTSTPSGIAANCHVVSHVLGQKLYERHGNAELALNECSNACGGGCTHGVVGAAVIAEMGVSYNEEDIAHLNADEIKRVGSRYCVGNPSMCHAIGHLLYLSLKSFVPAIEGCDAIATKKVSQKCYRGIFMEALGGQQELFRGDDATKPPPVSDDDSYPCRDVPERSQHACFVYLPKYQDDLFARHNVQDPATRLATRLAVCQTFSGAVRSSCIEGIAYSTTLRFTDSADVTVQRTLCNSLTEKTDRLSCILGESGGYSSYQRYDQAYAFCNAMTKDEEKTICFNTMFTMMERWVFLSPEKMRTTCALSEKPEDCLNRYQNYMLSRTTLPDYSEGLYGKR